MAKWSWQARFRHIEEAVNMLNELDDMPVWEDLSLKDALDIVRDVAELYDEENGDWSEPYEKAQHRKAMKFIKDFS